jgi:GMP synthase (glutamine-hydrolysing)
MSGARILVIDGNVAEIRARQAAALGYDSGAGYVRVLQRLDPEARCDIVRPADGAPVLPAGVALADYDGATITGSALSIYHGGDPVTRQVELTRAVCAAGVPLFGSCWGLQVAVTVAGGEVLANPRGREFGFGRRIVLNDSGAGHRMYAGKPRVFEAPTIHRDYIAVLPAGATALADNDYGLQAAAFAIGRCAFWGVQYHPEYDFLDIAAAAERYGATLVDEGMFRDLAGLAEFAGEMRLLQAGEATSALAWKHGLGPAVLGPELRTLEIRNWLAAEVTPRAARRR